MQRQDFWYSAGAQSLGALPTGAKAGQFLFLSGQTPVDLEAGAIVRDLAGLPAEARAKVSTPHHLANAYFGPIMAQTWTIYQNLAKILVRHGASLKDVIRQRIFLREPRESG